MKQIPLFFPALSVPGLQRCCNTKAWTETPLSLSHIHTLSLLIFFLLRLVLLSLSVFGQSLDALSAALLSNESVRGRESERKRTRERERERERAGGRRERECAREIGTGETKQTEWDEEDVWFACGYVCLGVEVRKNGDADTDPHRKHIAAVSDGDELRHVMEGRAN